MTSSKTARRLRREERRRRKAGALTEPVPQLRTASYDATTIEFTGASDVGLPDPDPRTEPVTRLRAEPRYRPPVPAGYAAATGPMRAIGRPAVSIGDALTHDDRFGPMLAPLPCGHCGTAPPVPDGILERTRIIGHVNWLAVQDGWRFDYDWIWTCPACQQDDAWKGRQGALELHRFDERCDRHDAPAPWPGYPLDGYRCTCPGAVVAVDVMLASEDHLGSGRGRYTAGAR
jgi:hypothetical protein